MDEICLTEVNTDKKLIMCTCNMMESNMISLKNDYTRQLGEPVDFNFPTEDNYIDVDEVSEISGTSYLFLTLVFIIYFGGMLVSIQMLRFDRIDWALEQANEYHEWQKDLLAQVADKLGQPFERVKLRKQEITSYYVQRYPPIAYITWFTHPLFAPFLTFDPTSPRLFRFNAYWLQLNTFMVFCMFVFRAQDYRRGDMHRVEHLIDAVDIGYVTFTTVIGSIAMMPLWLIVNQALKNDVEISEGICKAFV